MSQILERRSHQRCSWYHSSSSSSSPSSQFYRSSLLRTSISTIIQLQNSAKWATASIPDFQNPIVEKRVFAGKGHKTFRHQDTSAPTLSRITGGAVTCRNCAGSKVSRLFLDLMPRSVSYHVLVQKCLETVLKCLMRVRSVLWPKCPVTF